MNRLTVSSSKVEKSVFIFNVSLKFLQRYERFAQHYCVGGFCCKIFVDLFLVMGGVGIGEVVAARRSETPAPIGRTLGERFGDGLITFLF